MRKFFQRLKDLTCIERSIAVAFGLGISGGLIFSCSQTPKEIDKIIDAADGEAPTVALLALSPVLAGAVVVLAACWVALRTAAASQLKQADLLGEDETSERVAGARAWADIESIFSFLGFGFVFGAVAWAFSLSGTVGIISLVVALAVLIIVLILKNVLTNSYQAQAKDKDKDKADEQSGP